MSPLDSCSDMAEPSSIRPTNQPSNAVSELPGTRPLETDSRDIVQHLKNLDEQAMARYPERQARIDKGKKKRTYGFGRLACFCLSGGNGAG